MTKKSREKYRNLHISAVLQKINNEKEKQKQRRHKKKIEVPRELFSTNK